MNLFFFGHVIWHWVLIVLLVLAGVGIMVEFRTKLGFAFGALAILAATHIIAFDVGYVRAHSGAEIEELKAEVLQQKAIVAERDREAVEAEKIAANDAKRITETQRLADELQGKVDGYLASAPKDDPCVLTDDDVRGLQSIDEDDPYAAELGPKTGLIRRGRPDPKTR